MDIKRYKVALYLAAYVLVIGLFLRSWVIEDKRPTMWDESIHTNVAMDYVDRFKEDGVKDLFRPTYFSYPPLVHLTMGPLLNVPDDIADAGSILNIVYYAITIVFVYLIGRRLFGEWPAVTAAILFGAYPIQLHMLRLNITDIVLTAWVTITIYCLLRTEEFSDRRWSIIFGVAAGLTQMSKFSAFVHLWAPVLLVIFYAARKKRYLEWKNITFATLAFLVVISPWYLSNLLPLATHIPAYTGARPAGGVIFESVLNWFWYPLAHIRQLNLLLFLVFIPGLILCFKQKKTHVVLALYLGTIIAYTLITNRNLRYSMPALPAAALLSVVWIPASKKWIHVAIQALAILVMIGFHTLPGTIGNFKIGPIPTPVFEVSPPNPSNWMHDEVISGIQDHLDPQDPLTRVITLVNLPSFHSTSLNISLRRKEITNFSFKGPSKRRWSEFAPLILYKTGDVGPAFTNKYIRRYQAMVSDPPGWFQKTFKEVQQWIMPDGEALILYKADPDPITSFDTGFFNAEFDEVVFGRIKAQGVAMKVEPLSPEASARGLFKKMTFSCEGLSYKNVSFDGVDLTLIRPQINLHQFLETQEIQFIRLGGMKPNAIITTDGLMGYAQKKLKWLKNPKVQFSESKVLVKGTAGFIPLELLAEIEVKKGFLETELESLEIFYIPLPVTLLKGLTNRNVPLTPNRDMPFELLLKSIQGEGTKLKLAS